MRFLKPALVFLLALTLFPAATSADEKLVSVYSSVATYTLPVIDRGGHEYVGLLELLEPLGRVSAEKKGARWKLRYNAIDSEFVPGNSRAIIGGRYFDFPLPFLFENSRGLVPRKVAEHSVAALPGNASQFSRERPPLIYWRCRHTVQHLAGSEHPSAAGI